MCSYCPKTFKVYFKLSKLKQKVVIAVTLSNKNQGNNWAGFFDFFPSKRNWKKSKNPAWNDRREWNTKLQLGGVAVLRIQLLILLN